MNKSNSKAWQDFMDSEYTKAELQKLAKTEGREGYNVDPGNKTELNKSVATQDAPGGAEKYADPTVEGLEDIHSAMIDVATKQPHGNPKGNQDNLPEKWEGLEAAGSKIKNFTKEGQFLLEDDEDTMIELTSDEDLDLDQIIKELEDTDEESDECCMGYMAEDAMPEMDKMYQMEEMDQTSVMAASKKKTVALLKELVKIANELDMEGKHKDASEIDSVIKQEVTALVKKK